MGSIKFTVLLGEYMASVPHGFPVDWIKDHMTKSKTPIDGIKETWLNLKLLLIELKITWQI